MLPEHYVTDFVIIPIKNYNRDFRKAAGKIANTGVAKKNHLKQVEIK